MLARFAESARHTSSRAATFGTTSREGCMSRGKSRGTWRPPLLPARGTRPLLYVEARHSAARRAVLATGL
jgi:hypothetical protein